MLELIQVYDGPRLAEIHSLFLEYAESLGFNLDFQDFENELKRLPGDYAPPDGRIFLALHDGQPAGCVALREIEGGICEMKRMYVKAAFRGHRIGRTLAETIIAEAMEIGYSRIRLDTMSSMNEAIALYRSLGFREIEPYRYNPIPGAAFMELEIPRGAP